HEARVESVYIHTLLPPLPCLLFLYLGLLPVSWPPLHESLQAGRDMVYVIGTILLPVRVQCFLRNKTGIVYDPQIIFLGHMFTIKVTYGHWLLTFRTGHERIGPSTEMSVERSRGFEHVAVPN
ncbi:hypothetical protein TNCV_1392711, partial [Trichonephila clavipes]